MTTNDEIVKQRIQRLSDVAAEPLEYLSPIVGYEEMPVVPLETAVEHLVDLIPAVESHAYIAKQRCQNPADDLSPDESAAIMLYTMSWFPLEKCLYYVLNATLRSKDREQLKPWFLYLRLFVGGLTRLRTEQQTVYRGVKKDLSHEYRSRKTIIWWGFSSSTTHMSVLESDLFLGKTGARTMFNITCKSAPNIRNHSYFATEDEVLIFAGTQFKITSYLNQNDLHIIQLEEIKSRFHFLQPIPTPPHSMTSVSTETKLLTPTMPLMPPVNRNTVLEEYLAGNKEKVKLLFSRENLNDNDMEIVAYYAVQCSKTCAQLDLSKNWIGLEGARYLAVPLRYNVILKELNMNDNHIGQQGAWLIAEALKDNKTLVNLQLSSNQLGLHGVLHLAEALRQNTTLTHLSLENNQINNEGARCLAEVLQNNKTLRGLYFSRNHIEDQGIEHLLPVLQNNTTLTRLTLDGNKIGDRGTQLLNELKEKNTTLNVTW